jgi:hypothetical protein
MLDRTQNQLWKRMKTRLLVLIPVVLGVLAAVATLTFAATSSLDIFKVSDPVGDAQGFTNPNHDITSFAAGTDGSVLSLTVVFSGTVFNPVGDPNYAVLGYIDLDTDQNQATGKPPHTSIYTQFPPSNLGMDYYIDLSQYVSG